MGKRGRNQAEAKVLRGTVEALLSRHLVGDVEAGNQAMRIADRLARELTASESLDELLDQWKLHRYRPTLRVDVDARAGLLADLYDYAAVRRGIDVRAYRGVAR